jgi:pyruvate,orthophosphate dikinase
MLPTTAVAELAQCKALTDASVSLMKLFKIPLTLEFVLCGGSATVVRVYGSKFAGFGRFGAAVSMVTAGILTKEAALSALCPSDLGALMAERLQSTPRTQVAEGAPGSPGAVSGVVCHEACDGPRAVLVKQRLYPSDVKALFAVAGCASRTGGDYSRGAYYARSLSKPGAFGCADLDINTETGLITTPRGCFAFGDEVTLDGAKVFVNALATAPGRGLEDADVARVLQWADDVRGHEIEVQTIVASAAEFAQSIATGADGVGLFALEHLLGSDRESVFRFVATRDAAVGAAIETRLRTAMSDFLAAPGSHPTRVTVRLIDASAASFLGDLEGLVRDVAALRVRKQHQRGFNRDDELHAKEQLLRDARAARETNPRFGVRGVRAGVVCPEFFTLQLRAVLLGARAARGRGADPAIRILVPGVCDPAEFRVVQACLRNVVLQTEEAAALVAQVETPRACLLSRAIAEVAPCICIHTGELHAAAFGYDAENVATSFLGPYLELRILDEAPYATIDQRAVGRLIALCATAAREGCADAEVGVLGPNCCDEKSMDFCYRLGIRSFTCEPWRVPVARLCAAQAILRIPK